MFSFGIFPGFLQRFFSEHVLGFLPAVLQEFLLRFLYIFLPRFQDFFHEIFTGFLLGFFFQEFLIKIVSLISLCNFSYITPNIYLRTPIVITPFRDSFRNFFRYYSIDFSRVFFIGIYDNIFEGYIPRFFKLFHQKNI